MRNTANLERTAKTFNREPTELLRHCLYEAKPVLRHTIENYELLDHVEYSTDNSTTTQLLYITDTHLVAQSENDDNGRAAVLLIAGLALFLSFALVGTVWATDLSELLLLFSVLGILYGGVFLIAAVWSNREFRQPLAELPTEILLEIEELLHRDKAKSVEELKREFASNRSPGEHAKHLSHLKRNLISGLTPGVVEARAELLHTELEKTLGHYDELSNVPEAQAFFEDFAYLRLPTTLRSYRKLGQRPNLQQSQTIIDELNALLAEAREFNSAIDNPKLLRLFVYSYHVDHVVRQVAASGGSL